MSESEGTDGGLPPIKLTLPKAERIPMDYRGRPEITQSMKGQMLGEVSFTYEILCPDCPDDADFCGRCGGDGITHAYMDVPWTTMKDIYQSMADIAIKDLKNNKV